MTERLFKVLNADGTACHGGTLRWSLPNGRPGRWHTVRGALEPCQRGLHLCRPGDLLGWLGPVIYVAEAAGERIDGDDKIVVRRARLLTKIETWTEQSARLFGVACARRALERERAAGREPDVRSWAALDVATAFTGDHASARDLAAARAAASAAAWDAARDAASATASATAWDAARAAAWDAARDAASATASATAWDAAWDAERKWQTRQLMALLFPDGAPTS